MKRKSKTVGLYSVVQIHGFIFLLCNGNILAKYIDFTGYLCYNMHRIEKRY